MNCSDCGKSYDDHPYAPTMYCPPDCLVCEDAVRLDGSPVKCESCGMEEAWDAEYSPGYFKAKEQTDD